MDFIAAKTCTIAVSGTTSGPIQMESYDMVGLLVPTLDSSTLKVQVSEDGANWFDVYDGTGTQALLWPASTGGRAFSTRDLADAIGYRLARLVCGSPQNTGARTFTWIFKVPRC